MINLKVGICDDDMIYLNDIKSKLDQYIINNDVNISYYSYTKANDLLNNYKIPGKYDTYTLFRIQICNNGQWRKNSS